MVAEHKDTNKDADLGLAPHNDGVIAAAAGRVVVRVMRTDEELMIATTVCRVLSLGCTKEK